jgi:hypothetical protein
MKRVCIVTIHRNGKESYRFENRPATSSNIVYEMEITK